MTEPPSSAPRWLTLGLPLLLILIGGGWVLARRVPPIAAPAGGGAEQVRPAASRVAADAPMPFAAIDSQRAWREGGLRDTHPDGGVSVGFAGRLQPDLALRRLFDYFLGMIGQLQLPAIRQSLQAHLRANYADSALRAQVLDDFDRYAAYQRALPGLAEAGGGLPEQFERRHALRLRLLGEQLTTAFYADEERADQTMLERIAISRDTRLDATEKARQLAALDAASPAEQQARQTEQSASTIQAQTEQLDADQADPAARHAARAELWGEQAASGLDALDQQRDAWRQRLADYAQRSAAIEAQADLDAAARATALQQLRDSRFSEPEQRRLQALEQAGMLPRDTR